MTFTGWMGFVDGKPHIARDDRFERERHFYVYPSRRAASADYEDVRKVTIKLQPKAKRSRRAA